MALTGRQLLSYHHLCDIVSVTRETATGTKPGDETYALFARNVRMHYEFTDNVSDPNEVGRIKRSMIFTMDKLHFEVGQRCDDQWFVINRTVMADGSRHVDWGQLHRIEGIAKDVANDGARRANKKVLYAAVVEKAPPAVQTIIGT